MNHRHGGVQKFLSTLLRFKLIYHDKTTYNGACGVVGREWGRADRDDMI